MYNESKTIALPIIKDKRNRLHVKIQKPPLKFSFPLFKCNSHFHHFGWLPLNSPSPKSIDFASSSLVPTTITDHDGWRLSSIIINSPSQYDFASSLLYFSLVFYPCNAHVSGCHYWSVTSAAAQQAAPPPPQPVVVRTPTSIIIEFCKLSTPTFSSKGDPILAEKWEEQIVKHLNALEVQDDATQIGRAHV